MEEACPFADALCALGDCRHRAPWEPSDASLYDEGAPPAPEAEGAWEGAWEDAWEGAEGEALWEEGEAEREEEEGGEGGAAWAGLLPPGADPPADADLRRVPDILPEEAFHEKLEAVLSLRWPVESQETSSVSVCFRV